MWSATGWLCFLNIQTLQKHHLQLIVEYLGGKKCQKLTDLDLTAPIFKFSELLRMTRSIQLCSV